MPRTRDFVLKLICLRNGCKVCTKLVEKATGFLPAAVGVLWKVGTFICLDAPKKTLNFCIQTQKTLLQMPFRCISGFYKLIRRCLKFNVSSKQTSKSSTNKEHILQNGKPTMNAIDFLTDGDECSEKVISEMKAITKSSLQVISKIESSNSPSKIDNKRYDRRKMIDTKCDEIFAIAAEEKELIRVITAALKYFKSLKYRREKLAGTFTENQKKFFTTRLGMAKKILEYSTNQDVDSEIILDLKDKYGKLTDLLGRTKLLESYIESCLNSSADSSVAGEVVLNDTLEILQIVAGLVSEENSSLRLRLAITNEKLEDVLKSSNALMEELVKLGEQFTNVSSLNQEMTDLQIQLDKARQLLHAVEADRDEMKLKLMTLENMIKEEEDFLDDNSCESGYMDSMI